MASTPPHDDEATEGVTPTEADGVARPEQPPMDDAAGTDTEDDAGGLPDEQADDLGDFA